MTMSWAAILAAGVLATLVLTTALRAANEVGLTRVDLPLLMGTIFTSDRRKAKLFGYALHFLVGLVFAVAYGLILVAVGRGGWLWGAALGVLHSLLLGTVGVNVLLPAVHPRMGGDDTTFESSPLMEPPGILMLNYGRSTPLVSLVAHVAYGAIIGGLGVGVR
jgi:hypothetical protein